MGTLLALPAVRALTTTVSLVLVTDAVRATIERARADLSSAPNTDDAWVSRISEEVARRDQRSLRAVFNATGVVLHTNLGRAPLARAALDAIVQAAEGASNLEYDLATGERGSRYVHCASLVRALTGAEDALVVNNGAAALVLALNTLCNGREAIVSRGELIEIGGSFRVPEIMARSGAVLREVGTTNRTHLDDYRRVIGERTGALVKVHRSNFELSGFVAEVEVRELAVLAASHGLPLVMDLGSGLIHPLDAWGLRGEPTVGDAIRAGANLVVMSGDKLAGGPQAGILAGSAAAIAACRANPLTRALRVDKLTLAALEATLALHRDPATAVREIPTLRLLTATHDALHRRAVLLADALAHGGVHATVVDTEAAVGGGAFPGARLPSAALALSGGAVDTEARLRNASIPVITRVADGHCLIDLRSVPDDKDDALARAVVAALAP